MCSAQLRAECGAVAAVQEMAAEVQGSDPACCKALGSSQDSQRAAVILITPGCGLEGCGNRRAERGISSVSVDGTRPPALRWLPQAQGSLVCVTAGLLCLGLEPLHAEGSAAAAPTPVSRFHPPYPVCLSLCLLRWMGRKSLKPKSPRWRMGFVWPPKTNSDNFAQ